MPPVPAFPAKLTASGKPPAPAKPTAPPALATPAEPATPAASAEPRTVVASISSAVVASSVAVSSHEDARALAAAVTATTLSASASALAAALSILAANAALCIMAPSFFGVSGRAHTDVVVRCWLNERARLAARAPRGEDANICAVPPVPVPKKLRPRVSNGPAMPFLPEEDGEAKADRGDPDRLEGVETDQSDPNEDRGEGVAIIDTEGSTSCARSRDCWIDRPRMCFDWTCTGGAGAGG